MTTHRFSSRAASHGRSPRAASSGAAPSRGFSLVELLVGVAVGLLLLGGATRLFADHLSDSRRLLVEARLQQDLRAATELIVRDLRRAGHWRDAALHPAAPNPHGTLVAAAANAEFSFSRHGSVGADMPHLAGVRVDDGVLRLRVGGTAWQSVTDPQTLVIDTLVLALDAQTRSLHESCPCIASGACTAGQFLDPDPATGLRGRHHDARPRVVERRVQLHIEARATAHPHLRRAIDETVLLRNAAITGSCPAL